jgi:2-oxoglutarate dehydrogenase complex dehydrogenase (E1) component-like enzyme
VPQEIAAQVLEGITTFPESFNLHPKLKGFIDRRRAIIDTGGPMDWAAAEALAFGSLVLEGTPVRLSGQDSARGTFSQRHLAYFDYETGQEYIPLQHLASDQAKFAVYDSSLSEYAVLGYEFGYSVGDPLALVMWEAQFGDFVNGAQIMIDQFISSAEQKWGQPSGLVMLLPHGFEGQGPEHSSARIERFLSLCAEGNMQVANCTTPANYFHLLRRQIHGGPDRRGTRKPLVIFTPKSLLRHPRCVSTMKDLTSGGFQEVFGDLEVREADAVKRIVLCSGKVYYDLLAARDENKNHQMALVRVEQLYPFPEEQLQDVLLRYPVTAEVVWVQEEPQNMGPWRFMREHIQPILDSTKRTIEYIGRRRSASPATGSFKRHVQEQKQIVDTAFLLDEKQSSRKVRAMSRRKR